MNNQHFSGHKVRNKYEMLALGFEERYRELALGFEDIYRDERYRDKGRWRECALPNLCFIIEVWI